MAKKYRIKLSEQERSYLNDIVKKGKAAAYKRRHAHMLLLADECGENGGMKDEEIADSALVGVATVAVFFRVVVAYYNMTRPDLHLL